MPQLVQDEAGAYFVDTGGGTYQPVTEEQARTFLGGQGAGAGAFQAAGQGLENLITGAGSLLSDAPYWEQTNLQGRAQSEALNLANPVTSAAAQYAPQALAGAATGGAGILPTVGVEAALGAATTPESPIEGALVGAAGGALPFAVAPAARAGGRLAGAARDAMPWFRRAEMPEGLPGVQVLDEAAPPAGAAPVTPEAAAAMPEQAAPSPSQPGAPRMADRVTRKLDAVNLPEQGDGRVLQGTLTPETLARKYNIPTSEAQQQILTATSPAEYARALENLNAEEAALSNPLTGAQLRNIRFAQKEAGTNFIGDQLGIPPGQHITDQTLAGVFTRVGARMDAIAQDMGTVPVGDDLRAEFSNILGQTTGAHKNQLQSLTDEILQRAELAGGNLTGKDWGVMRTKLDQMIEAGMGQGKIDKIHDAGKVLEVMADQLESRLPAETLQELRKLRKQYAIASTLAKPGARDADAMINPTSFYNNWKRPQSKKHMGQDDVGEFMATLVTLQKKRTPDSGTAGRLLQNAASLGIDLVPGGSTIRRVIPGL